MNTKAQTDRPIQLQWNGGAVVITPEDQDRFVRESSWAVSACQSQLATERFLEQFQSEFLRRLHEWCQSVQDRIVAAYVPMHPNDHLQAFVVTKSPRFDFSLSEDISALEAELFERQWPCEVLQVPHGGIETLQTFFDPERSIQVYGEVGGTSG